MNGKDAAQRPKNRRHVANDVAGQQLPKGHSREGEGWERPAQICSCHMENRVINL